jgi:methylated-DNA-[protein]-cysteine S-methyltransferase
MNKKNKSNKVNNSMSNSNITTLYYKTPDGDIILGSCGEKLCMCDWDLEPGHGKICKRLAKILGADADEPVKEPNKTIIEEGFKKKIKSDNAVIDKTIKELDEYFAGRRKEFDIPLLFVGTDFQKKVWNELLKIPFGQTVSYMDIARKIKEPKGVRAVANAIGANPMSIIVPCHRVIASNNTLGGYAGGLKAKKALIERERVNTKNKD